jgi:D-citramalate synthase
MLHRDEIWGIALLAKFKDQVRFLDTTLRDGEQTPGVSLTPKKKLEISLALDDLGVDVIEAGFAAVSEGEVEALKLVASQGLKAEICSAARGIKRDIDAAIDCDVDSVNIIIPTSDLHIEQKLGKTREEILETVAESIVYAREHGLKTELSAEDGSRTDPSYMKRVMETALENGVDRIALCDTVGTLTPERAYDWLNAMRSAFGDAFLSFHGHNDFGLATSNSLAALTAGADQVHTTINGVGERAGNASLEEVAVALKVLYGVGTRIRTEKLYETSQLVSRLMGVPVQPNKAIVGANAFSHESGIHTHAVLRNPLTYEAITPELVGAARSLVSGKHAGSAGLWRSLRDMGLKPSEAEFKEVMALVKAKGDNGERVTDADLMSLAWEVMKIKNAVPLRLEEFIVTTGNNITPTSSVRIRLYDETFLEAATGNGPVDATLNAVSKAIDPSQRAKLDTYHVEAITGGTDARVNVEIRLRRGERVVTSKAVSEDIVMASVDAFLRGMNVLIVQGSGPDKWERETEGRKPEG